MTDLDTARAHIQRLAAARHARGAPITPDRIDQAAALLVDLWAVAASHGIPPTSGGPSSTCPAPPSTP